MFIVFGQNKYGKVDRVPGLFHVVTEFFHIYYVPLIPLKSYLMFEASQGSTPISLHLRSVLMGWARALLICVSLGSVIAGLVKLSEHFADKKDTPTEDFVVPFVVAGACVFVYWLSTRFTRASYERALALAEQLGLEPEHIDKCFQPQSESPESYEQQDR